MPTIKTKPVSRLGLVASVAALVVASCGMGEADEPPSAPLQEQYADFEACMEEGGYSADDFWSPAGQLTPEELAEAGFEEEEGVEVYGEIDWDLMRWQGECTNRSGIGEAVIGDPEVIAARTEEALGLTRCMRGRGWDDFPDPQPHPAPFDDGLVHAWIDIPEDLEEREAFIADFSECSDEVGVGFYADD